MTSQQLAIGLTGGIGSGKSTVAAAFRDLGIKVVDADQASRAVVEPGSSALQAIDNHFAQRYPDRSVILPSGELNRPALREIIFADADEKHWLEQLLHPLIEQWIISELHSAGSSPYVILESPLLLETGQQHLVDGVLLVDSPPELQLQRASHRDGTTTEQIQAIINTQMSREQRRERADWIIDNTEDAATATLVPRVQELHQVFLDRIEQSTPSEG